MALTKERVQEEMKKGAVVVNVLGPEAFGQLHIEGSVNLPLMEKTDETFAKEVEQKFGKGKMLITHCSGFTCTAGPRAASILKAKGFKADDYPGGIEDWEKAGLPMEGTKAVAHKA